MFFAWIPVFFSFSGIGCWFLVTDKISAAIEIAISCGVSAPIFKPTGPYRPSTKEGKTSEQ